MYKVLRMSNPIPQLSSGAFYSIHQAWVVQKVVSAIRRINYNPVDSVMSFVDTYLLNSDLSGG